MLAVLFLPLCSVAEIASHAGDDGAPLQRLLEQCFDVAEVFRRQLGQGAAEIVRDGELGGQNVGEAQFAKRVRVDALAAEIGLPRAALSGNPDLVPAGRREPPASRPFVDPDPFRTLTFANVIAAKLAIADALRLPLAKLEAEDLAVQRQSSWPLTTTILAGKRSAGKA